MTGGDLEAVSGRQPRNHAVVDLFFRGQQCGDIGQRGGGRALAFGAVYPASTVAEKRKGFGCILLDTDISVNVLQAETVVKESGGAAVSEPYWLFTPGNPFYGIGFLCDKTSDTTVKK
jgi:hypothetical protein